MINKALLSLKAERIYAKWGKAGLLWWLGLTGVISIILRKKGNTNFYPGWKEPFDENGFRLTKPRISDKHVSLETGGVVDEDIYPLA